jgi:hypothetical protein
MKFLKHILTAIAVILGLILLIALFVEKDFAVERDVIIEQPKEVVFDYVKHIKNQDNYTKWNKMDPNSKKTYTGTDGTVGFVAAWDSENDEVGKGEQEITKIIEGERIESELRFQEPFESTSPAFMTTEAVGPNKTKVSWGFSGHMNYPMNLMLLFIDMEEELGKDMQQGLDNLKLELEK